MYTQNNKNKHTHIQQLNLIRIQMLIWHVQQILRAYC